MAEESWYPFLRQIYDRVKNPPVRPKPDLTPPPIPRTWQDAGKLATDWSTALQKFGSDPVTEALKGARKWWQTSETPTRVMKAASVPSDITARALDQYLSDPTVTPTKAVTESIKKTKLSKPLEELTTPSQVLRKQGITGHGDPISNVVTDLGIDFISDPTNPIPGPDIVKPASMLWKNLKVAKGIEQLAHGTGTSIPKASRMVHEGFDQLKVGDRNDIINRYAHAATLKQKDIDESLAEGAIPRDTISKGYGETIVPMTFPENAKIFDTTQPMPWEDIKPIIDQLDPVRDKDKIQAIMKKFKAQHKYVKPGLEENPKIAGLLPEKSGPANWRIGEEMNAPQPSTPKKSSAEKAAVLELDRELTLGGVYGRGGTSKEGSAISHPSMDLPFSGYYYRDWNAGGKEAMAAPPSELLVQDPKYWHPQTPWIPWKHKLGQTFPVDRPPRNAPLGLGEEGKSGVVMRYPVQAIEDVNTAFPPKKYPTTTSTTPTTIMPKLSTGGKKEKNLGITIQQHVDDVSKILEKHGIAVEDFIGHEDPTSWSPKELHEGTVTVLNSWDEPNAYAAANEINNLWHIKNSPQNQSITSHAADIQGILNKHNLAVPELDNLFDFPQHSGLTPEEMHKEAISTLDTMYLDHTEAAAAATEIQNLLEMKQKYGGLSKPQPKAKASDVEDILNQLGIVKPPEQPISLHVADLKDIITKQGKTPPAFLDEINPAIWTPSDLHEAVINWAKLEPQSPRIAKEVEDLWKLKQRGVPEEPSGWRNVDTSTDDLEEIDPFPPNPRPGEWGSFEPGPGLGQKKILTVKKPLQDHINDIKQILENHGLSSAGMDDLIDQGYTATEAHESVIQALKQGVPGGAPPTSQELAAAQDIKDVWQAKQDSDNWGTSVKSVGEYGLGPKTPGPVKTPSSHYYDVGTKADVYDNTPGGGAKTIKTFNTTGEAEEYIKNHPEKKLAIGPHNRFYEQLERPTTPIASAPEPLLKPNPNYTHDVFDALSGKTVKHFESAQAADAFINTHPGKTWSVGPYHSGIEFTDDAAQYADWTPEGPMSSHEQNILNKIFAYQDELLAQGKKQEVLQNPTTSMYSNEYQWKEGTNLHGVPMKTLDKTPDFWATSVNDNLKEPDFHVAPGTKRAAGVVITEPDGRVWTVAPKNQYGGYNLVFPKGTVNSGETKQVAAAREVFEETGLHVKITGHLVDVKGDTSTTRFYTGERIGGAPWAHGDETAEVRLIPIDNPGFGEDLKNIHGKTTAHNQVLEALRAKLGKTEPKHPMDLLGENAKIDLPVGLPEEAEFDKQLTDFAKHGIDEPYSDLAGPTPDTKSAPNGPNEPGPFTLKPTQPHLGGAHPKEVYTSGGKDYIFKPMSPNWVPYMEQRANDIAKIGGIKTPEMTVQTIGGKTGTMQSVYGNKTNWPTLRDSKYSLDQLTTSELKDIISNHPVDWLTANHDAHDNQWLMTPTGVIPIDRGQAFRYFGKDSLSTSYHPNAAYGEKPPIYYELHDLWKAGKLPQLSQKNIDSSIEKTVNLLNLNYDQVRANLENALILAGKEDLIPLAMQRLDSLGTDIRNFWDK